jgi:hypothetical protein
MGFIPHPPLYLSQVRPFDMLLLLAIGAVWEVSVRLVLFFHKAKPAALVAKEDQLVALEHETATKRKLGPSAFVETSKLERQVLALEKEVEDIHVARAKSVVRLEKHLLRYGNMGLAFVVFIFYFGIPIMTIQGLKDVQDLEEVDPTGNFLKALMFPVSYVGFGTKISKWGMDADQASSSIGGLMVMWSAQVTTGKLMDAFDAYFL